MLPQNNDIVVTGRRNKQCEAATGVQGWIESGLSWAAEASDDAATVSAVTGQEEIAVPAEIASWAFTSLKAISQASRGDTHGAAATFTAAASGTLVGKLNKIIPIGKVAQKGFNSAVSSTLGYATGKTLEAAFDCE